MVRPGAWARAAPGKTLDLCAIRRVFVNPRRRSATLSVMDEATNRARRAPADELVAARCQLGERLVFDLLLERWHAPLAAYVTRLAGDDEVARDVGQDTW